MKIYSHSDYDKLIEKTVVTIKELSTLKGGEYAGDTDRLANFRRNAANLGLNNEDVWSVYASKHWDAVMQYVRDLRDGKTRTRMESISGRADDLIVYLILFKALLEDRNNEAVGNVLSDSTLSEHFNQIYNGGKCGNVSGLSRVRIGEHRADNQPF